MTQIHHKLLTLEGECSWRSLLPASQSVFGSYDFARLQQQYNSGVAHLFAFTDGPDTTVYPFLLRPLSDLRFTESAADKWDAATPQFTGPSCLPRTSAARFSDTVHELFVELGVVTEFMHLDPWNGADKVLVDGELCFDREIVWVDTTLSEAELWQNHFSHACRKNLKRAAKEDVKVFEAANLDDIREFQQLYSATMDRNQALSSYYLPTEYFVSVYEQMGDHARFVMAECRGRIVAATLYMHDDVSVYSYLGGASYDYQHVRPTNAIVNYIIAWARRAGKKRLVLGGGYRADDGIFCFKASFSQLRAQFYTFRRVHLPDLYESLRGKWCAYYGAEPDDSYFPIHRSPGALRSLSAVHSHE